jgi:predicted Zn-dependent protease
LDLAALFLGAQDPERALEILDRLQGESHQRPRRLTLLAVARSESGDEDGALWAVSAAIRADPTNSLPRVQEALLLVSKDPLVQAEAWDRVVQVAGEGEGTELAELIQGLRAQVAGTRLRESLPEE